MPYTYEQLKEMTVAELREIAKGIEHDAVKGHTAEQGASPGSPVQSPEYRRPRAPPQGSGRRG